MKANQVLETAGLICPIPIYKLSQAIKKVPIGGIVELQVDDTLTQTDLPLWCEKTGHHLVAVKEVEDYTSYFIKRTT